MLTDTHTAPRVYTQSGEVVCTESELRLCLTYADILAFNFLEGSQHLTVTEMRKRATVVNKRASSILDVIGE